MNAMCDCGRVAVTSRHGEGVCMRCASLADKAHKAPFQRSGVRQDLAGQPPSLKNYELDTTPICGASLCALEDRLAEIDKKARVAA